MRKIVYICSLGHSGSTLLSLILGQHNDVIPLGEILSLKDRSDNFVNRVCTCGEKLAKCDLWGDVISKHSKKPSKNLNEDYGYILSAFSKAFNKKTILCDSSKILKNLATLNDRDDVEVKVIFLIKDFRAYLTSVRRKKQKKGIKFNFIDALRTLRGWYRDNNYNLRYLEKNGYDFMRIGYEELTLYPSKSFDLIFNFLDLETPDDVAKFEKEQGHMIYGNRMRKDPQKKSTIRYDNAWFTDNTISFLSFLMPKTAKFNKEITYSNGFQGMWKK